MIQTRVASEVAITRKENIVASLKSFPEMQDRFIPVINHLEEAIFILDDVIACENKPGPQKIIIDTGQIEFLIDLNFKLPKIAELMNISLRTLKRRMQENHITVSEDH